jgi:hypothetical protein
MITALTTHYCHTYVIYVRKISRTRASIIGVWSARQLGTGAWPASSVEKSVSTRKRKGETSTTTVGSSSQQRDRGMYTDLHTTRSKLQRRPRKNTRLNRTGGIVWVSLILLCCIVSDVCVIRVTLYVCDEAATDIDCGCVCATDQEPGSRIRSPGRYVHRRNYHNTMYIFDHNNVQCSIQAAGPLL